MSKLLPFIISLILISSPVLALWQGGSTAEYNYNPFGEVAVETGEDFTLLFLIMMVLILILYKGEVTLENLIKIKERRKERVAIKKKRKMILKRIKDKKKARKR